MLLPPPDVLREQLTSLFHGHALWMPDPGNLYERVSIGDVGYVKDGYFVRMFNVLLDWSNPLNYFLYDAESNPESQPENYVRLDMGRFTNIRQSTLSKGDYYSRCVTVEEVANPAAHNPEDLNSIVYTCRRRHGALLTLPFDGLEEDIIRTKVFEDYIRDHVDSWFTFARRYNLDVERMEDLILVTGCTLVTSWGVAAFVDSALDSEISLRTQVRHGGGATFDWRVNRPAVNYRNSYHDAGEILQNQCVFIRGFRAKRVFIWTRLKGAAEPRPDDPDNRPEDEIEVTRVPNNPQTYRDPLIGVLDYIAEKCPETTIAIAHENDLQNVEEVEVLTADAVEGFLRQNETNVLVENGVALLQEEETPEVPEERKAIFYAAAELEGELVPLELHPVLSKYYLTLDISNQGVDHDFDLPIEELNSPAVYPPLYSLKLENHQGYPQSITLQVPSDSPSGITVQDALKTINEDVRQPSRRREWIKLSGEERAAVDGSFRERCRTEEELGQGPCRIDYLRGRNRLQILPRLSPEGEMLPAPIIPDELRLGEAMPMPTDESNVAGPSRIPIR